MSIKLIVALKVVVLVFLLFIVGCGFNDPKIELKAINITTSSGTETVITYTLTNVSYKILKDVIKEIESIYGDKDVDIEFSYWNTGVMFKIISNKDNKEGQK